MLPAVWAIDGVPDLELLCRGVLREQSAKSGVVLEPADFDEWLAFLLGEVHVLVAGDPHSYCSNCAWRVRGAPPATCPACARRVFRSAVVPYDPTRGVPVRIFLYGRL